MRRALVMVLASLCSATPMYAITAQQCSFFESDGKVAICHATESAKHPYVLLTISEAACIQAHTQHPEDFVSVGGSTCSGQECLPSGAPCDATLPCCEGSACGDGSCQQVHGPESEGSDELVCQ